MYYAIALRTLYYYLILKPFIMKVQPYVIVLWNEDEAIILKGMVYSYLLIRPNFAATKNKVMRNLFIKTLLEGLIMCVCVGALILFMAMFTPSAAQTKTTTTTYTVVDDAYVVSKSKKTGEVSSKGISASVWDEQVTFNVSPTSVFTVVKRPSGEWVQYGTVKIVERIVEEGIVYFVTSTGKQYSYKL